MQIQNPALIYLPFRRKGKARRKPGFKRFLRFHVGAAPRHNRGGGHTDDGPCCCSHDVEIWVGEKYGGVSILLKISKLPVVCNRPADTVNAHVILWFSRRLVAQ